MNSTFKSLSIALSLIVSAGAAHASLLDFTDPGDYTISPADVASGAIHGVGWTLTASGGDIVEGPNGPGNIAAAPLEGITDGFGIRDDELTAEVETFTLAFEQSMTITNLFFLDLFIARDGLSSEVATVTVDGGPEIHFVAQVSEAGDSIGFGSFAEVLSGSTFVFTAETTNDTRGAPDYALAGLEIAPIPLPAGILLLGGALAGLGIARRRAAA